MGRVSFHQDWAVGPKVSIFAGLTGQESTRETVRLPHDAQFSLPRRDDGEGWHNAYFPSASVEYVKRFEVPAEWREKRISVQFEGVYRDAMVYVNDVFAAQRPNGYTRFEVGLDPYLRFGETNSIRVEARAHQDSRWYSGVGIHRDCWLLVEEPVHLATDGVRVTTPEIEPDRAIIAVATVVVNESPHTATVRLETVVLDQDGTTVATDTVPVTVRSGQDATVRQRLLVSEPRLWGVQTPALYEVRSSLRTSSDSGTPAAPGVGEGEERSTWFGIRHVQVDPERGLRINGEPIQLRGACIHHANGILGSAAFGRAEERRVQLLKNAGFNAIRSAHNPISPAMLDACDRVGMLVMDETFDVWTESKSAYDYSLAFPRWWECDLESMVAKDFNHPSVIFYSIGNEIPETGTPLGAELGRQLAEKLRALDSTRLITNGINGFVSVLPDVLAGMKRARSQQSGGEQAGANGDGGVNAVMGGGLDFMGQIMPSDLVTERTEESFSVLDVAGLNYGDSRYALDARLFPNRVIVGTETFPGNIDRNWRLVRDHPHVIGDFTWTGWDYLGEVGIGRVRTGEEGMAFQAPYPWLTAWCGDIDITGYRRPQSYYREIVFGLRHEPFIAVERPGAGGQQPGTIGQWSWTDALSSWTWDAEPGTPMRIEVYSAAHEVELLLNGESVGRAPAGEEHRFVARFSVPYAPGDLEAVAYDQAGNESARTRVSASGAVRLTATADRTRLVADHRDLAFVAIEFRDAAGVLATTVRSEVAVSVGGVGELLALGSARPDNAERFDRDTHRAFDGRLLAVVRPTEPGDITVTITTAGQPPVELHLSVHDQ